MANIQSNASALAHLSRTLEMDLVNLTNFPAVPLHSRNGIQLVKKTTGNATPIQERTNATPAMGRTNATPQVERIRDAQAEREDKHSYSVMKRMKERMKSLGSRAATSVKTASLLSSPEQILDALRPLKPLNLSGLIRKLIDAESAERFTYTLGCILELYEEYLPDLKQISVESITETWRFLNYCRYSRNEVENDVTEEEKETWEPQAFVKISQPSPQLSKLCENFGLSTDTLTQEFTNMEIPLVILSGLLGLLAIFCGDKLAGFVLDPKILHSTLGRTARAIRDIGTIWTAFDKVLEEILNFIGKFFGYKYISKKDEASIRIAERIEELKNKFDELQTQTITNLTDIIQSEHGIDNLEQEVNNLDKDISKLIRSGISVMEYQSYIRQFHDVIKEVRKIVFDAKSSAAGKQIPVVVYLAGSPGLGKSTLASHIVRELEKLEERQLSVYTRTSAEKFWSGYLHQDVVLFDDFGQSKKDDDHLDAIMIHSPNTYSLNMSESHEKGKRHYTSRYDLRCSNLRYFQRSEVTHDLEALNRKRDFLVYVKCEKVEEYKRIHGTQPPANHEIWKEDFSHLKLSIHKAIPPHNTAIKSHGLMSEVERELTFLREITVQELVQEIYTKQLEYRIQYATRIKNSVMSSQVIADRLKRVERQNQELFDILPNTNAIQDLDRIIQDEDDPMYVPQSIQTIKKGCNLKLLQGPSGCGKSHLMRQMDLKKIYSLGQVVNDDGTLKIPVDQDIHLEDISITPDMTNKAMEIIQVLSDHDTYTGTVIMTANTDMLMQNVSQRGDEALEVVYRRCELYTVMYKPQRFGWFQTQRKATDLPNLEGVGWDDLYSVEHTFNDNVETLNLADTQLSLSKNTRMLETIAIFDKETIDDFENSEKIVLEFPSLTWEMFQNMENYTSLGEYMTGGSLWRAVRNLGAYLHVFKSLPTQFASPSELVDMVNKRQLRLPSDTPSARLRFKDFEIALINHKTYVLLQIRGESFTLPDIEWRRPQPQVQEEKKTIWNLVQSYVTLCMTGTMVIRELFGMNQGKKQQQEVHNTPLQCLTQQQVKQFSHNPGCNSDNCPYHLSQGVRCKNIGESHTQNDFAYKFVIYAPCNAGKTTFLESTELNAWFGDTDDDAMGEYLFTCCPIYLETAERGIIFTLPKEEAKKRDFHAEHRLKDLEETLENLDRTRFLEIKMKSDMYISDYAGTIKQEVKRWCPDIFMQLESLRRRNRIAMKPEGKKNKIVKKTKEFKRHAKATLPSLEKTDPSSGSVVHQRSAKFENDFELEAEQLQKESRRHISAYDQEVKKETKILTHTDIEPRYIKPDYDNEIFIHQNSRYHPKFLGKLEVALKANDNITQAYHDLEHYLQYYKLDPEIYHHHCQFEGLSREEALMWNSFFTAWRETRLHPEAMADQQAAALIPILIRNQVFVYTDGALSQRAMMVGGRVGVTTSHGIRQNSFIEIPRTGQRFAIKILQDQTQKDICIFKVEKTCPEFKDIRKFIRSIHDQDNLNGMDAYFVTVHKMRNDLVAQTTATKIETRKEIMYERRCVDGYVYAGTVKGFDLPLPTLTEQGHCGSPAVILNSRYERKILSIHSAGSTTTAFGLPIYTEMFYDHFEPESKIQPPQEIVILPHQELEPLSEPYPLGEFKVLYQLKHNNSTPNKTDIYRSPLQSEMFGDNFEPAILSNYDTRNVDCVDINHVTIEKWAKKQPEHIDEELLDEVVDEWANYFADIVKDEMLEQWVLTKTEAINRTTYYQNSQPIPRDTSAGYPWKHRPNSKGKELYIQPRTYKDMIINCIPNDKNGQDLHAAINNLISTCDAGKRPAVVFSSSAKDEVLKKKKIYPCRTRGFAGAPIDFSIAHRMYFHTAICSLIQTRNCHPIKVGIEANKDEWTELWNWMADNSTVGFDADFKDWDATIPRLVMEKLYRIYNAIYEAVPRTTNLESDNRIRKNLHSVLWGPLLTLGQTVVQAPGGQVSGQPATTIDNCLVGLIIMFYAWMKLAPRDMRNFAVFQENVRIAVFGDDQMATVKPECLKFFNLLTVTELVKNEFGMEITSAAKDGKSIEFKQLIDMEFLKRNFIKVGPYYFGKLQPAVFDKMLNWTHTYKHHHYFRETEKVHFEPITIEASVQSMLPELALYPPDIYLKVRAHCSKILRSLGIKTVLPTQKAALEQRMIPHKLFFTEFVSSSQEQSEYKS